MKISEVTDLVYKYAQANEQLRKDHERLEAEVKFYTTKRVGGEVVNSEAIKLLKLSA